MPAMGKSFLHFIKVSFCLEQPHSQTTQAERLCLRKYASDKKRLVEIGVYEGLSTVEIALEMAPGAEFYTIDPFFKGRFGICWAKWIAIIHLWRKGLLNKVRFIEKLSVEAAVLISGSFDFIFIDGDHSIEGIKRDYSDWAKRIVSGGILALHDTSVPAHNPNVTELGSYKYFQESIRNDEDFELLETVDSLNILRKRRNTGSL